MSDNEASEAQASRESRARRAIPVLLALGLIGTLVVVHTATTAEGPAAPPEVVEIPDRFAEVVLPPAPRQVARPIIEPARKKEPKPAKPSTDPGLSGLLGTVDGSCSGDTYGIGGIGGMGSRGSGLGGGGYGAGMGGLGSKGYGVASVRARGNGANLRIDQGERGVYYVPPPDNASIGTRGTVSVQPGPQSFTAYLPEKMGSTEQYTDHGVGDTFITDNDRFSTFAVDVDTGSYTIARRKLKTGILPPSALVRVEEFVNYFKYRYPSPAADSSAPFAVHMEAAPDPFRSGHHILRIGVKGKEVPQVDRPPVHLTFLVDVSGSMSSPDKLGLAQRSLHFLVDQLGDEDSVAIATYAGRVERVLEPTWTSDRSDIHAAIERLSSGGSTAMSSGIDLAYEMASEQYLKGHENRVIVLSDGDANVGPSSHEEILKQIGVYAGKGITLTTVGFGMGNYKDTLMEQLSNKGDGNYFYIDEYREAKRVFGDGLMGTIQVIARDTKIQVEFNPQAVMAYRLIGYENRDIADKDFRNDAVDAGEIGAGHRVTAVYDVVLRDEPHSELATVRLRAKPPGEESAANEWLTPFESKRMHADFAWASPDFRLAYGVAQFAELLRRSPHVDELTYAQVYGVVDGARRDGDASHEELLKLVASAGALAGQSGPWSPTQ